MDRRTYKVVSREEALGLGAKTFSGGDHNRFALVAVRGDKLDNVVSWGWRSESLQKLADIRNEDIAAVGRMVNKAIKKNEEQDVATVALENN